MRLSEHENKDSRNLSPERFISESGHERKQPWREVPGGVDGVAAVVAEGNADVQDDKASLYFIKQCSVTALARCQEASESQKRMV